MVKFLQFYRRVAVFIRMQQCLSAVNSVEHSTLAYIGGGTVAYSLPLFSKY